MKTHFKKGMKVEYGIHRGLITDIHHKIRKVECHFKIDGDEVFILFESDGALEITGKIMKNIARLRAIQ